MHLSITFPSSTITLNLFLFSPFPVLNSFSYLFFVSSSLFTYSYRNSISFFNI